MPLAKRIVIGANADKKSAILYHDSPNEQDIPNVARRSTLWATTELPINNSIKGDRGADVNEKVKQKYPPTEIDMERHPTMHRTDTLDCFIVARGEIPLP